MAYNIKGFQQTVGVGLGTWTYTVMSENVHTVRVFSTEVPPSGLIITIDQNGTAVGPTPTTTLGASQTQVDVRALVNCQVGDVITVVLSSPISGDPSASTIKTTIDLYAGL